MSYIIRPATGVAMLQAARATEGVFTLRRWLRLPYKVFLNWIELRDVPLRFHGRRIVSSDLREPTPAPILFESDLKPGFHFIEYVH